MSEPAGGEPEPTDPAARATSRGPVGPLDEPFAASMRRAARRAVALLVFAAALIALTWLPVGRRGGRGVLVDLRVLVPLLTTASGLLVLAAIARPVRATPARLAAQHLGLGLAGTTVGLIVFTQEWQLRALEGGGDPIAGWSAALAAIGRLRQGWNSVDAVLVAGAPIGAAVATLAFSGGRQGCGWALLIPLPGLALLAAAGHLDGQSALQFGACCTVGLIPWFLLFQLAERPRRLLSGGARN